MSELNFKRDRFSWYNAIKHKVGTFIPINIAKLRLSGFITSVFKKDYCWNFTLAINYGSKSFWMSNFDIIYDSGGFVHLRSIISITFVREKLIKFWGKAYHKILIHHLKFEWETTDFLGTWNKCSNLKFAFWTYYKLLFEIL